MTELLLQFADWLSLTSLSVSFQVHAWVIPTIQSVHIVGIGVVVGSVLMMNLRILGMAGADMTLRQTTNRFGPWLTIALWVLLVTGILMVIGEPVRELLSTSFWFKMFLVATGTLIATAFQMALRKHDEHWESTMLKSAAVKFLAIFTLMIWVAIIFLGRLIAYDSVWGAWSIMPKR
jgi:hypothetical protein